MSKAETPPQRPDLVLRLLCWAAAGLVGCFTLGITASIIDHNLHLWVSWVHPSPSWGMPAKDAYERSEWTKGYRLALFGIDLARDDNLDGRDTRDEIHRLGMLRDWLPMLVGLLPGVIVAGVVNAFLRMAIRRRKK